MGMFLAGMVLLAVMGADGSEAREAARRAERAAFKEQVRATLILCFPNDGRNRGGNAPAFPERTPSVAPWEGRRAPHGDRSGDGGRGAGAA